MKYFGFEDMPAGQNCIAAIACFTGYNQEDSVLLNKAAVERGLFRSMYCKSITGEEFGRPDPAQVENKRKLKYNKIEENGFPDIGTVLKNGEVMIGKTSPTTYSSENAYYTNQEQSKFKRKDISVTVKTNADCIVDNVMLTESDIGKQMVKIRTRQVRIPEVGDKVASCNGQKGTCGLILAQEDMPFTSSGITPDLIMNTHAIPSQLKA
jgi:DNA-directed RNA polymerase II subunit RPB2